jgi:hypothetical protein
MKMQRVLGLGAAAALLAAGVIHVAVVPEHLREYAPFGVFFVLVAAAQLAAALFVLRDRRGAWPAIAAFNIAVCLVWAYTRFVALPLGPEAGGREAIAFVDALATGLQVAAVAVLLRPLPVRVRVS